jgi:hypothetical protein
MTKRLEIKKIVNIALMKTGHWSHKLKSVRLSYNMPPTSSNHKHKVRSHPGIVGKSPFPILKVLL